MPLQAAAEVLLAAVSCPMNAIMTSSGASAKQSEKSSDMREMPCCPDTKGSALSTSELGKPTPDTYCKKALLIAVIDDNWNEAESENRSYHRNYNYRRAYSHDSRKITSKGHHQLLINSVNIWTQTDESRHE